MTIISKLHPSQQRRVALGNCMKNTALVSATVDGKVFTRNDHRQFWKLLKRTTKNPRTTIHLTF